jgi:hypothetical protein
VEAPSGRLTGADRLVLAEHKADLLALLRSPWDLAEAEQLLEELRAEVRRIESKDFAGRPPDALRRVLADALAIGQGYIDNHAAEAARGWDALALLRGLKRHVHQCAANARRPLDREQGR